MDTSATAGVEFLGSTMRYAEIEHTGELNRLLRLGDCEFEFDAHEVVFGSGPDAYLETVAAAIAEVFAGSGASVYRVAVHPPSSRSFMSSVITGTSETARKEQLIFEAALLDVDRDVSSFKSAVGFEFSSASADENMLVASDQFGTSVEENFVSFRNHVSHTSRSVDDRLGRIFSGGVKRDLEIISSAEAIGNVVDALDRIAGKPGTSSVSIGTYENYSMFTVVRDGERRFSQQRRETDPADIVYFALQALSLAGERPIDVQRLHLYGSGDLGALATSLSNVFGTASDILNPIATVDLNRSSIENDFTHSAFTMCIGAAL